MSWLQEQWKKAEGALLVSVPASGHARRPQRQPPWVRTSGRHGRVARTGATTPTCRATLSSAPTPQLPAEKPLRRRGARALRGEQRRWRAWTARRRTSSTCATRTWASPCYRPPPAPRLPPTSHLLNPNPPSPGLMAPAINPLSMSSPQEALSHREPRRPTRPPRPPQRQLRPPPHPTTRVCCTLLAATAYVLPPVTTHAAPTRVSPPFPPAGLKSADAEHPTPNVVGSSVPTRPPVSCHTQPRHTPLRAVSAARGHRQTARTLVSRLTAPRRRWCRRGRRRVRSQMMPP